MIRSLLILLLLTNAVFDPASLQAQTTHTERFLSRQVGDSFRLHITVPASRDSLWGTVYYLDAGIRSGAALQALVPAMDTSWTRHVLFVGIAHTGDFHSLRRRDFIPPYFYDKGKTQPQEDYGQAQRFHAFLEQELLPYIDQHYRVRPRRTLVGHSFGGLFALYALFRPQPLFDHYVCLSPSLWTNRWDFLNYEKELAASAPRFHHYLYLSAGGWEGMNLILTGTRRMKRLLEQRQFPGLRYAYEEHPGKGHNDAVPPALRAYFTQPPWQ